MVSDRDRTAEGALDRFWDEQVQGRPGAPNDLDTAFAETVRHLQSHDDRPAPSAAFVRRLREELAATSLAAGPMRPNLPPAIAPNGRLARLAVPPATVADPRRVQPFAHLATAGLLVVTLVSTLVVFALLHPARDDGGLTGGNTTATSTAEVDRLLIDVTISPPDLPDPANIALWRRRLEPGQQAVVANDKWSSVDGLAAEYVLSGQLGLSIEAPFRVVRAGLGQVEEIPAATEVILGPGDLAIYAFAQRRDYVNTGSAPTELLLAAVHDTHSILPMVIPGYHGPNYQNFALPAAIRSGGPVPLTVRRLTLSPGTPTPETARWGAEGMQLSWTEPPGPATPTRIQSERTVYVLTLGQVPA